MSTKELLKKYLNDEENAIEVIRKLSGVFNPDYAIDIVTLINAITRIEQKDLDRNTFKKVWGLE